jgi:hypothetical protein
MHIAYRCRGSGQAIFELVNHQGVALQPCLVDPGYDFVDRCGGL